MIKEKDIKLYPLTAAQKLHFYTLTYCPKKQVLNIGISARYYIFFHNLVSFVLKVSLE